MSKADCMGNDNGSAGASNALPSADRIAAEVIPRGYPWPASRLTRADMANLTDLRTRERKPITMILHDAVVAYHRLLVDGIADVRAALREMLEAEEALQPESRTFDDEKLIEFRAALSDGIAIVPERAAEWEWKLASVPIDELIKEVQRRVHRAAKPPRKEPKPPVYRVGGKQ